MRSRPWVVLLCVVTGCAARQATAPGRQPAPADPAVDDAARAVQRVDALNATATDCEIERSSACCVGFVARSRADGPRPPPRTSANDPDCGEGPPGHRPRGPVLCYGQRVPTGVARGADGGCVLGFD